MEDVLENIDNYANNILHKGGTEEDLLLSMNDILGEIKKVVDASTHLELDSYCHKHKGFYRYARLLEKLSEDIADETIHVPK